MSVHVSRHSRRRVFGESWIMNTRVRAFSGVCEPRRLCVRVGHSPTFHPAATTTRISTRKPALARPPQPPQDQHIQTRLHHNPRSQHPPTPATPRLPPSTHLRCLLGHRQYLHQPCVVQQIPAGVGQAVQQVVLQLPDRAAVLLDLRYGSAGSQGGTRLRPGKNQGVR